MKIKANKILAVLCVIAMVMTMIVPMSLTAAAADTEVVFELGANGSATHADGSEKTPYTETVGDYTLNITGGTKMYTGARDAKGNSCIKLGTGSAAGKFTLTVPNDVTSVVIYVAGYKTNTAKITINSGSTQTITTPSNNGEYTAVTVDTSSTKEVVFTTVSGGYRCMINTIEFYVAAGGEGGDTPDCEHANAYTETEPATKTQDGYEVEYCPDCEKEISDRRPISALGCNVDFVVPTGVETPATHEGVLTVTMPGAPLPAGNYAQEYEFAGWAEASVDSDTNVRPTLHGEGTEVALTDDTTFYAVYSYKVSTGEGATESGWIKKDIASIVATDVVVITMTKESTTWALSNDNGTGSAPTAVVVTVENNKITSAIADTIKWNISNNNGSLTIYPNGTTATWLYSTSTNNGTRVGTNDNKTWVIDSTSGYLKHTGTNRYLGVYNGADWRAYTNTTGNTAGQTLGFYVWSEGGVETYYTSVPSTSECDHSNAEVVTVPATCTEAGSITTTCECGYSTVETIEALGHDWDDGVTNPTPNCTEEGTKTYTCTRDNCDETKEETIPALGHSYVAGVCTECGEKLPAYVEYTFSEYAAGTQYAENETHKLDSILTVTTTQCHFTSEIRIYSSTEHNGYAILTSAVPMYSISFNAGNKADTLNVYGLVGEEWVLIAEVAVTSTYNDYTVNFDGETYTQIKLDVAGENQIRLKSVTAQYDLPAKITQMSVNAGADLSLLAHITLATGENATDYRVVFTHIASGETFTVEIVDGKAILDNIAPQAMGDLFKIELVKGEDVVDTVEEYSIKAYAQAILNGDYSAELKAFVSDMLVYGAEAQKYMNHNTENLATDGVDGLVPSDFDAASANSVANVTGDVTADLGFKALGVKFDNKLQVYAKFESDAVAVTINEVVATLVAHENGGYVVYSNDILATEFNSVFTIVVTNGEATQTFTYSVNSFIANNADNTLAQALYNYGCSAEKLA